MNVDWKKYYALVNDLRDTGRELLKLLTPETDKAKVFELCGLKMLTAANEFEKLLRHLIDLEDDRK